MKIKQCTQLVVASVFLLPLHEFQQVKVRVLLLQLHGPQLVVARVYLLQLHGPQQVVFGVFLMQLQGPQQVAISVLLLQLHGRQQVVNSVPLVLQERDPLRVGNTYRFTSSFPLHEHSTTEAFLVVTCLAATVHPSLMLKCL